MRMPTLRTLTMLTMLTLPLACDLPPRAVVAYMGDSQMYDSLQAVVEGEVWQTARVPVVLAANPGYGLISHSEYFERRLSGVAHYHALVVYLGTNDAVQQAGEPRPLTDYPLHLAALLSHVPHHVPVVWVTGDTSVSDRDVPFLGLTVEIRRERFQRVHDLIEAQLAGRPHVVLDPAVVFAGCTDCRSHDGIHYTNKGQRVLHTAVRVALDSMGVGL